MSSSIKNLIVILGIVTVAFAGYYFFNQEAALVLRSSESDEQLGQLLLAAQEFSERQRLLNSITMDTSLFESELFQSLQDFSPQPNEYEQGRPDPFSPIPDDVEPVISGELE